jgi:hypothetical protein
LTWILVSLRVEVADDAAGGVLERDGEVRPDARLQDCDHVRVRIRRGEARDECRGQNGRGDEHGEEAQAPAQPGSD